MIATWRKLFKSLIPPRPPAPTAWQKERAESVRRIVAQHARGNVHLQMGRYLTRHDIDALYKRLQNYHFAAE